MTKMRFDKGEWLALCGGRRTLILENIGDEMFPNLHTREVHEPVVQRAGTDAPGTLHAALGGARSSVEQTDWHNEAERAFLRGLADRLDSAVTSARPRR